VFAVNTFAIKIMVSLIDLLHVLLFTFLYFLKDAMPVSFRS